MVHAIVSLAEIDPFQASAEECRESGHTINRSLAETRAHLAAWIVRQKIAHSRGEWTSYYDHAAQR